MRPRFKRNRLCSSDNYELSRKVYETYMQEKANKCLLSVGSTNDNNTINKDNKKPYVKVFGKLIPLSFSEASSMKDVNIIYK